MRNVDRRRYIRDQVSSGGEVAVRPVRTRSVHEIIQRSYSAPCRRAQLSAYSSFQYVQLESDIPTLFEYRVHDGVNEISSEWLPPFVLSKIPFLKKQLHASQLFSFLINRYSRKIFLPSHDSSFALPRARVTRQWNKFPRLVNRQA